MTSRGAASPTATGHELLHTWATSTNPAGRPRALRILLPPAAPRRGAAVCQVQGRGEATPRGSASGTGNRGGRCRCLSIRSCRSWSPAVPECRPVFSKSSSEPFGFGSPAWAARLPAGGLLIT
jgi:hypothetical protein